MIFSTFIEYHFNYFIFKPGQRMNLDKNIENSFHLINQVRSNPSEFAHKYRQKANNYNGKIFKNKIKTREGVGAFNDLINDLKNRQRNASQLKWSFGLHMIADEQARKLGESGLITTEGSLLHKSLQDRAKQYAVVKGKLSELYEFGGQSGEEIVDWLLIDDGLASRKRRNTLLNPTFKYIGIGTSLHRTYGVVTVIALAEDVISLVAPGQNGNYIKREPIHQGQVKTFKIEHKKLNERDIYSKSYRDYSRVDKVVPISQAGRLNETKREYAQSHH